MKTDRIHLDIIKSKTERRPCKLSTRLKNPQKSRIQNEMNNWKICFFNTAQRGKFSGLKKKDSHKAIPIK